MGIMEVSIIPIEDALRLPDHGDGDQEAVEYFTFEDTKSCLLNCYILCYMKLKEHSAEKRQRAANAVHKTENFTISDVVASARNGCRGCHFLEATTTGLLRVYEEQDPENVSFKWDTPTFTLRMVKGDGSVRKIQLFNILGAKTRVNGLPESNILLGNTYMDLSFDRVHVFLKRCEAEHAECGSGRNVRLPKRLLNVGNITCPNGSGKKGIRLEHTEDMEGTYACLSHCWGDASKIHTQTKARTIDDYLSFIAWSDLPRTFRDAVILCRRLGVKYLWIDSLCIIQDSRQDWEVESVKMGEIYQNSYLTIAASAARQSSDGCFSETIADDCVLIQEPEHPDIYVGVRDCQGAGVMRLKKDKEQEFHEHFPLFTRAWVYQERMLSRRILFCNKVEFEVGCRVRLSCECGQRSVAPHFKPGPKGINIASLRATSELERHERGGGLNGMQFLNYVYRDWLHVVDSYAKLNITKPSDKLPALSAAAKVFSRNIGGKYLAGIWSVSLMEGLLWYVRGRPYKPRPSGPDWRAPSWSWASVDPPEGLGFITPGEKLSFTFNDKIEHAECVPSGENKLGEVSSGFIRLKAALGKAFWCMRCRGCAANNAKKAFRGRTRVDNTLYTTSADRPDSKRCTFPHPALDLMGAGLSFYADAYVEDESKYGFLLSEQGSGCRIAPCYLLHVPRRGARGLRGVKQDEKRLQPDAFLVLTKVQSNEDTFERVALAVTVHDTEEQRTKWFEDVWSGIALPETSITLV
ncbi:heterokaryon incompatibility protein-domain-containing protein [Aspergillus spectabilis]